MGRPWEEAIEEDRMRERSRAIIDAPIWRTIPELTVSFVLPPIPPAGSQHEENLPLIEFDRPAFSLTREIQPECGCRVSPESPNIRTRVIPCRRHAPLMVPDQFEAFSLTHVRRVAQALGIPAEMLTGGMAEIHRAAREFVVVFNGMPIGEQGAPGHRGTFSPIAINQHTEHDDNTVSELLDLARANDEAGFRALAACVVAPGEVDALWAGTRKRVRAE